MNPKKKSRRCLGLGLDSGLDLAISRFIYSFEQKAKKIDRQFENYQVLTVPYVSTKKGNIAFSYDCGIFGSPCALTSRSSVMSQVRTQGATTHAPMKKKLPTRRKSTCSRDFLK
jgi:hypothetical protein